jgi:hypothetical protein
MDRPDRGALDDPNLVANVGLLLLATISERPGLEALIDATVRLDGRVGGARPGRKVLTLADSMCPDSGLTALVTGGGYGLGRELVHGLAAHGATVRPHGAVESVSTAMSKAGDDASRALGYRGEYPPKDGHSRHRSTSKPYVSR